VTASALPRLLVLTDRRAVPGSLVDTVRAAVDAGATALVVRERDLPAAERGALADACEGILAAVGGVCVVAAPDPRGGVPQGLQLRAADPLPGVRPTLLGRSVHDAGELARASAEGLDYVTLSPVAATVSKPGYGPALGAAGLRAMLGAAGPGVPPVFALGGVEAGNAASFVAAGAYGVAVMGGVMRAERPGDVVAGVLAAVAGVPPA
jgi:thiamine-phosphate pyrophosphorylase